MQEDAVLQILENLSRRIETSFYSEYEESKYVIIYKNFRMQIYSQLETVKQSIGQNAMEK